jgi:hypothetical protein
MFTSEAGETRNRAEDIVHMTFGETTLESVGTADRKVRVIGNAAVVETGNLESNGNQQGQSLRRNWPLHNHMGLAKRSLADR